MDLVEIKKKKHKKKEKDKRPKAQGMGVGYARYYQPNQLDLTASCPQGRQA